MQLRGQRGLSTDGALPTRGSAISTAFRAKTGVQFCMGFFRPE